MARPNIPVVMYHCINNHPEAHPLGFLSFSADEFQQHLRFFRDKGYIFLTIDQLWRLAISGGLDEKRYVVLTFDDGFLDNYLVAADIMRAFDARGTIFVNPGHAPVGKARSNLEMPGAWGYLNFEEMRQLEQQGLFDIQSHTMTHEMVFCSEKIIDFYEPAKFDQYHWLVWMLFPETLQQWQGDVYRFAELVPNGYPIFEYDRCLAAKAFHPTGAFIDRCGHHFQKSGDHRSLDELRNEKNKGTFESDDDYLKRTNWQIREAKRLLEAELNKEVIGICFPGGAYDKRLLSIAKEIGHRLFMFSSRDKQSDNTEGLLNLSPDTMTGLSRISFTKEYPQFLNGKTMAYWNAKLKVGTFVGDSLLSATMHVARTARNMLRKKRK